MEWIGMLIRNVKMSISVPVCCMERKYDHRFKVVFDAIKQLIAPRVRKKGRIGF